MKPRIPIIISVDVEPDVRGIERDNPVPWRGFEETYKIFRQLRPDFAAASGSPAHFSWFLRMDPQIEEVYGSPEWAARYYSRQIESLKVIGDEIGLNSQAWKWEPYGHDWVMDLGDPQWVGYCLRMSFNAYEKAFGEKCESFRMGSRWHSTAAQRLASQLGAKFDLTLEPGHPGWPHQRLKEIFTEDLPDFTMIPQTPYQPSVSDYRLPAAHRSNGLWAIPLSVGKIYYKFGRLEKLYRKIFYPHYFKPVPHTLNLNTRPTVFGELMDQLLMNLEKPYLAFIMRSDLPLHPGQLANMKQNLDYTLNHWLVDRFVFSTPQEALDRLVSSPDENSAANESPLELMKES